ncbi:MAG: helix-turn-helix domain-containing protein, partial [Thermoplasmata archaeon]
MERTYKFRLYPKDRQVATCPWWLNLLHTLYNAGLEQRIIAYREYHK